MTVDSSISLDPTNTSLTYTNPANVEILSAAPEEYKVRINAEGIYQFTVNVTDIQGNIYTDTISITAWNKTTLDSLLKGKWEGMKSALLSGNIEGALVYFVDVNKDRYRQTFTELSNRLSAIFSNISEFELDTVYGQNAECSVSRIETVGTFSYPVHFMMDETGIWKIVSF